MSEISFQSELECYLFCSDCLETFFGGGRKANETLPTCDLTTVSAVNLIVKKLLNTNTVE